MIQQTILITGIGGFIGLRTTELALERGMKVRGLQRSSDKAEMARKLGAEVIVGSVTDPIAAKNACQGADIVLHTAAVADEGGSLEYFRDINVGGTLNMVRAAQEAGVKTFVHLSSVMVYGFSYPNLVSEEEALRTHNNPYCQTKIEAERELLKFNDLHNSDIIIIRPGDVYGPRSRIWVVRPLLLMHKGLFSLVNGGKGVMNHVYIDNLIEAIFLALEKEAYGEIFNITDGQETSWKEYFTRLAIIGDVPAPFSLPAGVLKFLIHLRNFGQIVFGKKLDVLPESVDFVTRPYPYSIEKAKSKLGYQPSVSLDEGMQRTKEWLKKTDFRALMEN